MRFGGRLKMGKTITAAALLLASGTALGQDLPFAAFHITHYLDVQFAHVDPLQPGAALNGPLFDALRTCGPAEGCSPSVEFESGVVAHYPLTDRLNAVVGIGVSRWSRGAGNWYFDPRGMNSLRGIGFTYDMAPNLVMRVYYKHASFTPPHPSFAIGFTF